MADNKDKKVLNAPDKREQNDARIGSAEREEQVTKAQPKGNVPALRFPEFTGEWESVLLEDVAEFQKKRISSDLLNNSNYISTENILQNFGGVQNSISIPTNTNVIEYQRGDVLLSNIRPYLKKVWLSDRHGGCSADVFVLRGNQCERRFLYYVIASDRFINFVMSGAKGVKMPRGDKSQMEKFAFFIPTNVEQQKIAMFLSMLDERIRLQNKIIEKLETLIKGIVDVIFTSNKFPKVPFKEVYLQAGEGGTPATSIFEYHDNGDIPFIKIDDLKNKYIESNKDYITELGLQKSPAWIVPSNSIIYSNGATIGAISINKYPVCTKQGILGIVPKANINVEFLYYFMTSTVFTKEVERIVTEGTMRTAYLKDINHILCPIPCSAQQDEIAKLLSTLSAKLENEVTLQSKLQNQKEFLLSRMFI